MTPDTTDKPEGNGLAVLLPAWARLIAYLGFPIAVSVFFLAQSAGLLPTAHENTMTRTEASIRNLGNAMEKMDVDMREHRIRQEDLIRLLTTGLTVMCENGARTVAERNNCTNIKASARYTSP